MLGGIDPVILIQLSKRVDTTFVGPQDPGIIARIPIISQIPTLIDGPLIPIYLSQELTGIQIDTEEINIDIDTDVETLTDGAEPDVNQKGIQAVVSINLIGKKTQPGLILLTALMNLIFNKLTSKEYAITYLSGPITVFRGVLQGYSLTQNADNELCNIKIELSKGSKNPAKPSDVIVVPGSTGAVPL